MIDLVSKTAEWAGNLLERVSDIRAKILIAAGLAYVVGYVVWSINAWGNNLGVLPALELQYVIAGFIPVIVFMIARGIWVNGKWFLQIKWPSVVSQEATGWKLILRLGVIIVFLFSLLGVVISSILSILWVGIALSYLAAVSLILMPPDILNIVGRPWKIGQSIFRFLLLGFLPTCLLILAVFYFFFVIYPRLPQEFGGISPRCAYLDIAMDSLSKETLEAILPSNLVASQDSVVRSNRIYIYFSGGSTFLIKPENRDLETTYEINKNNIRAVTWCR